MAGTQSVRAVATLAALSLRGSPLTSWQAWFEPSHIFRQIPGSWAARESRVCAMARATRFRRVDAGASYTGPPERGTRARRAGRLRRPRRAGTAPAAPRTIQPARRTPPAGAGRQRSEEHTSELQ